MAEKIKVSCLRCGATNNFPVMCYNCQAQGTKKLCLYSTQTYQLVAEVPVVSWSNGQIVGTIPNVPAGIYYFMITDNGQLITHEWKVNFTVN